MAVPDVMARIVSTHYRYKRPPKKKRPVAIEVPEVVTVRHRKGVAKAAKSDSMSGSKPKAANDDRKAAIVTAKTPTEIREERRRAEEAEWSKESPRFQQGKSPKAIVTSVGRKEARFPADDDDTYEAATARSRAYIAKKLRKLDDD